MARLLLIGAVLGAVVDAPASATGRELAYRSLRAELATSLGESEYRVEQQMSLAYSLTHQYREVFAALERGEISSEHARVVVDAGAVIGGDAARGSGDAVRGSGDAVRDPGEAVCEFVGYGPVDAATARDLAGATKGWDRVRVDGATGAVLSVDRYRPSEELRRLLRGRDRTCRFPGCRVPANRCDLDHTVDAAKGGATSSDNLASLCRGRHTLKHHSYWTVEQEPGGVMRWTSPAGREHVDRPPGAVARPARSAVLRRIRSVRCAPADEAELVF